MVGMVSESKSLTWPSRPSCGGWTLHLMKFAYLCRMKEVLFDQSS